MALGPNEVRVSGGANMVALVPRGANGTRLKSKAIRTYLESQKNAFQLVEPHNHRANNAEQAVQTFKNHLIAGLCTYDGNFPSLLWPHLI